MSELYIKFCSKYLSGKIDVTIITPDPPEDCPPEDFFEDDREFPVLWLLHGGYGCFADWVTYNSVPRYAVERETILVVPYAPNSDFGNHPEVGEGYYFADFFLKELVPFVQSRLKGSADPERNLISGNSMGCAAAWRFGLQRPDLFGYVGPLCNQPLDYSFLEPYRSMTASEFREYASREKLPTAYGIDSGSLHAKELGMICTYPTVGGFLDSMENTLIRFREAAAAGTLPNIFVSGAEEAQWGSMMGLFRKYVEENHIDKVTFDMYQCATHNSPFWEQAVERFMEFAGLKKVRTVEW